MFTEDLHVYESCSVYVFTTKCLNYHFPYLFSYCLPTMLPCMEVCLLLHLLIGKSYWKMLFLVGKYIFLYAICLCRTLSFIRYWILLLKLKSAIIIIWWDFILILIINDLITNVYTQLSILRRVINITIVRHCIYLW